jgi:hypothetical protein
MFHEAAALTADQACPLVVLPLFSRVSSIMSSIFCLVASILATMDHLFNTSCKGMKPLPSCIPFSLACLPTFQLHACVLLLT